MRSRVLLNLLALALVSAVLLLYAFTELLVGAVVDDTYPIEVVLAESGGLLGSQEVTVSGRVVGKVDDVWLEGEGVVARLAINDGERIPSDVRVTVLRRSPIGEQAIDFRPVSGDAPPIQPGERITALDAVTPVPVQRLLEKADAVLQPVDGERAGVVVKELAAAVRRRREDIRSLVVDGTRLSEALVANERDIERFFAHSATVNAALARSREALARSIGQMADASEALVRMRADFEGLLREAPPVLRQVEGLVGANRANLTCVFKDLGNLNATLAKPENIDHLEEALRLNQWFFEGARVGAARDPANRVWTRIKFLPPNEKQPDSYLPDKRPIPDIRPGGACVSPLGTGAPAASQPGYEKRVPEARIVHAAPRAAASGYGLAMPAMRPTADESRTVESLMLLLALGIGAMVVRTARRTLARGRA